MPRGVSEQMDADSLRSALESEIAKIRMIDSHCHIIPFADLAGRMDVFKLFAYYNAYTLLASGMSVEEHQRLESDGVALEAKAEIFWPCWRRIRNTACAKVFLKAMKALHGIDALTEETYRALSAKVSAAYAPENTGWYQRVLKEAAGIDLGILDYGTTQVDRRFFVPAYRFENRRAPAYDHFITVRTRDELEAIEAHYQRDIVHFDGFLDLYEEAFARRVSEGVVAVKLLLAYLRTLDFSLVTKHEAERVFNSLFMRYKPNPGFLQHQLEGPAWSDVKLLQDFMVHQTLRHALRHRLVVQIHVGYQAGRRNVIAYADPKLLNPLFIQYGKLKFVLMHTAMPYTYDAAIMMRNFPNVAMDFSWTHQLSPAIVARVMSELMELLPVGKLLGFGSDNSVVEGALGEAIEARRMLANVLSSKVEQGYFSEVEAVEVAQVLLRTNAIEYFNLSV
jgi:hypothetical protein